MTTALRRGTGRREPKKGRTVAESPFVTIAQSSATLRYPKIVCKCVCARSSQSLRAQLPLSYTYSLRPPLPSPRTYSLRAQLPHASPPRDAIIIITRARARVKWVGWKGGTGRRREGGSGREKLRALRVRAFRQVCV